MAHAWLDSLSEDWVSQPRSDASHDQLPSFSSSRANTSRRGPREPLSRIPRLNAGNVATKKTQQPSHNSSAIHALNERSSNEINIRSSQRGLPKTSQGSKASQRGRNLSRSVSASTAGSVVHNSVQHSKSQSASPSKSGENVPEWKRRLVYGELNYGESKDLFSSAGTGLEGMFRPPAAPEPTGDETIERAEDGLNETTLPSSPPPYSRFAQHQTQQDESYEQPANESLAQQSPLPTKQMKFRRTEEDTRESSRIGSLTSDGQRDSEEEGTNEPSEQSVFSLDPDNGLDASRKVSGQSVIRNEDLSPIFISRHNSGDGKVTFAPVELPADQLHKRLEVLRKNQILLDSEPNSRLEQEPATVADGSQKFEDTDDFIKNGGFLNIQRGGRSAEGSFRRRPLSPPLNIDTSEMLPESSLQASTPKQFPTIRIDRVASNERSDYPQSPLSPAIPPPPHPSPEKRSQPPSGQSGSPLKLFGPYDTFTNQTLLRRISQFEDPQSDGSSRSMGDDTIAVPTQESPSKSEVNKGFMAESSPRKVSQHDPNRPESLDGVSTFGAGELDGYEFSEDITQGSIDNSRFTNKENMTPVEDSLPPSQFVKFQIHQDQSLENTPLNIQRRRNKPPSSMFSPRRSGARSRASNSSRPQSSSHPNGPSYGAQATPKRDGSDGKRPRPSPSKDPTPKRRRTLHRSDIAYGLEDRHTFVESVQSSHRTMQSVIGRKRPSVNQGELQQPASPSVLATRQIIRPRSPTPGQRSARERQPLGSLHIDPDHRSGVPDISAQDFAVNGSGRTSMKTQDFFDAAEEIMAMIRNKARPQNGLSSVEESEAESAEQRHSTADDVYESSFQESTKEPFSRPPSREGPPLTRAPTRQEDPELVIRLKKYEERSDLGEIITNSMQSMGRIREAINEANSLSESIRQSVLSGKGWDSSPDEQEVVSDLPNVRISRNPDRSEFGENTVEFPSNGSQRSGTSTARSIPTGSSQGSDSKRLILPDVVTPLIGDQVGNMVFDKENKVWRKVRQPKPDNRNILPSEDSEDPFGSIPDLSVDIAKETQNLERILKQNAEGSEQSLQEETPQRPSTAKSTATVQDSPNARMTTNHTEEMFMETKHTHMMETAVEDDKEIEHEITIHEDRMQRSSPSRKRNLTISFSSPIASVIQDQAHQSDDDNAGQEPRPTNEPVEHVATDSLRRGRGTKSPRSVSNSGARSRSRSRSARNLSVKGQDFVPRPVSRIDEQDEDTVEIGEHAASEERQISIRGESSLVYPENGHNPNTSLSVVVTTPAPAKTSPASATPIIGQYVGCLSLSPLSDFTMHQADQSCGLEVSYVVGDRYLATGDGSKKIMSKAIQNLVEKITEVEPFEPDWESMNELDINDKQLTTLHMLDEFCTGVVTLNASNNSIEHLDGVPGSVRNLRITHNHLSELTAWGHLMNLQYVDVSNNQIRSLHAFKDLVHLRSLRADNNQIASLDGIKMHDSLQVLRARHNLLTDVNLDGTKLQRLTELDLQMNEIRSINGIEQLTCLVTLNLQHNSLPYFGPTMDVDVPNLKYLALSNNDLTDLDLSPFPSLRLLHADRNQLSTVTGFSRCRRLDSLSLREQRGDVPLDVSSFLNAAYEVRKLFLSGNLLASFDPSVDFLNLQLLELANCGLPSLPPDLGQLMPNLRALNLNMNALDDVAALRYIPRLKKLLVAGNRLADAAQVADVLAGFPHLSRLDVRDNPATQGFYAPIQALVPAVEEGQDQDHDPFVLPDADPRRDAQFSSRSDLGTRMRRRVYDMVVLDRCRRLKMLDGLPVARGRGGGAAKVRDRVWEALVRSGVVREADAEEGDGKAGDDDGRSEASSR
ncbi:phosphotyrosine-specific ptp2-like protein [Hypoxylon texense]